MDNFYKTYGNDSVDIQELFSTVSGQIVFFGHQSVGENIMTGISILEEGSDIKLNRISAKEYNKADTPAFIDFRVGQNGDVISKIDDFVSVVESIPNELTAIAFFKLCYVDVGYKTDVEEVFKKYKNEMLNLKESSDNIKIVLFTVPLTTVQKGWKSIVKKILRREPAGHLDNIKRNEFNKMILNDLSGDFPVFDLALVESTLPGGDVSSFKNNGEVYPCLSPAYASDYGHLNEFGSKVVASNLLAFLAKEFR